MPKFLIPAVLLSLGMGLIVAPAPAMAQVKSQFPTTIDATDPNACWRGAAQYHSVDMWLLYSIAWVESRMNPTSIGRNKNGTLDLGLMQINTIWLPELARHGITSQHLMDSCTSVYVGAWILARNIKRYGYTWRAIGAYNSGTPTIGYGYAQKVYATHRQLTGLPTTYTGPAAVMAK